MVQSNYGYHIFKLERRAEPVPLDKARKEIEDKLQSEKNQTLIDNFNNRLRAGAQIKIYRDRLGFNYVATPDPGQTCKYLVPTRSLKMKKVNKPYKPYQCPIHCFFFFLIPRRSSMKINIALLLGIALLGANVACAQENDVKPIDEVIVRVNAGVIMCSTFEGAQRELLEELKKQYKGEELEKKFNEYETPHSG